MAFIYTYKKREVRLFFTLLKGFAIPVTGRKTTEVHARYIYTQPHPFSGVDVDYTYPRDIHCCCHDQLQTLRRF